MKKTGDKKDMLRSDDPCDEDWSDYVRYLASIRGMQKVMLCDLQGNCLCTSEQGFCLSVGEFEGILQGYRTKSFGRTGVTVDVVHFKLSHHDNRGGVIARHGEPDTLTCSLCKTDSLLIVAVHKAGSAGQVCNDAVMFMGEHFMQRDL